jgi:NCAIR mutase (PurE)-related protein
VNREQLRKLLRDVKQGVVETDEALESLARLPFVELEDARIDTHRALRHGIPEVVYGPGKTIPQIVSIVEALRGAGQDVLATRVEPAVADGVLTRLPDGNYDPVARLLWYGPAEVSSQGVGTIAVVSAGTSDLPVAAEATEVARRFGNRWRHFAMWGSRESTGCSPAVTSCAKRAS